MLLIHGQNIKKYNGTQLVLDDVTFEIHEGEHVGLIGRNGSGKSTLLQLIAKLDKPDDGQLTTRKDTRIGYLAQIPIEWEECTVYEVLASGYRDMIVCRTDMTELEQQMSTPEIAGDPERLEPCLKLYAQLQEQYERGGGYELDAGIDKVATGLQIDRSMYERRYASLSGGEKTKIALASQLIGKPDLLLLDEPTNHLDLIGVEWLEQFLNKYEGACLIVSHDRYFLDRVVTKIVELEDGESCTFHTDYSGYVKEKEEKLLRQFADYQEQQKKIHKMKEAIKQLIEWGRIGGYEKFFRRAASMQKALDRMEKLKRPVMDPKVAEFELKLSDRSGRRVIRFEDVSKKYGAVTILNQATGMLEYGEKVMLIGGNGSGKTTLLKLILGEEQADEGTVEMGARVEVGYLAQQQYPPDRKKSVLDYFREEAGMEEGEARSCLASYMFYGADVFKSVSSLSGGEWTRLRLALLVLCKPNLLILDEPTNHMDIASREALEESLAEFQGTVLAVTHDRYFINRLAHKIWELDRGKITVFLGDFDAYKEKSAELRSQAVGQSAAQMGSRSSALPAAANSGQTSSQRQRGDKTAGADNARREQRQREQLELSIAQEESRLSAIDASLQDIADSSAGAELTAFWSEREAVQARLDRLYEQWMQLEEET
ncbi:ABC-F family ATP-binding cassette domain-containing protein [Paenibacillus allorhizosphaerae]|uniref:Energy-dependent translational throttle protein EttA n=1 Tax=Paenibacillus allorhizosphaerae TaxID=2849866 RepID=A0ABM8VLM6_9BACL|nr:ABC-F type ribosomal protection protein [Paenibacillus allorhizosphaerae]CAG7648671.1 Energy-dependent translational throttle protein EttA [Paenibacillus allorhizosphaerae]